MAFTLKSTARLPGGHQIPLLGLGVYQNYDARTSVLQALDAGYRHIDSAQAYRNEEAVGQGVAQSSVEREDVFVSKEYSMGSYLWGLWKGLITVPCPLVRVLFVQRARSREGTKDTNRHSDPLIRASRNSDLVRDIFRISINNLLSYRS